jgi:predicted permease
MGWTRYFHRGYWDAERARELDAYLEEEAADNIARGMAPTEARRAAHLKLGNAVRIREEIYEMNTIGLIESAWQDLRFGARLLRRNPTFAVVAILTLALGTGANAAIFQLVDALRFRTLPVADPHQLVEVRVDTGDRGRTGRFMSRRPMMTNPLWEHIRDAQQAFSSAFAWSPNVFDLAGGGEVRAAQGLWVSGGFFDALGVRAARGRLLAPADDVRGCSAPGAVISDGFWHREYGGDPGVVGRTILLDGHRFDIVGITPAGFFGVEVGRAFDVALPLCSEPIFRGAQSALDRRDYWFLATVARLKPGWTPDQAAAHLRSISAPIFRETLPPTYVPEDAKSYLEFQLTAVPAQTGVSALRGTYETPLFVLLGVTGLVLLIACANLANLLLARATARQREISVRLAIGASRRRIVRQMLSESLLLAAAGAAAGLLLARWLSEFLVAFLSTDQAPLFLDLAFGWRVFAFTAGVAAAACLLFGLAPALRATGTARPTSMLATRGATDAADRFTLRRALVVVQVALSLVLVVGALLFGRSLLNLTTLNPGFRLDGVVVANLDMRLARLQPENLRAVYNTILERVAAIPGVDSVAEAFIAPLSGSGWNNRVVMDGTLQPGLVNFNAVGPGYFRTLATPVRAGREFTAGDVTGSVPVAVVNELFVRKYLAGVSPLGRVFHIEDAPGKEPNPRYRIIGVVADTKYTDLREELPPIAYLSALQEPVGEPFLQLVLHSSIPPTSVAAAATQAIREVNPAISVQYQTMRQFLGDSLVSERLMATLSGFFGILAMLIATIGLYGVMSYMVARRRMEIGIRMALGAERGTVVRMVVGDAARLLAVGLVVGIGLSIWGARSARALLYGLEPWDPATLAMAVTALGAVALVASWLPADRASRAAPTAVLREE